MHTIQTGNILIDLTYPALDFFFQITRNYGWAIILLTIALKAVMYPLTVKQYESMAAMQIVQPKIKEAQRIHSKDPQRMQKELMAIYKEHGVNPFGGCLPVLVQLPVLIALFATLSSPAVQKIIQDAGSAGTFFWIDNFAKSEALQQALRGFATMNPLAQFLTPLVVLVAVSTYLTQKTMKVTDPTQAQMMVFMPVFMLFICANLPTGVLLYWVTSNLLTAAQQYYLAKQKPVLEKVAVIEVEKKK
jgi:YidC/Oxa1 family membrane protein insertase